MYEHGGIIFEADDAGLDIIRGLATEVAQLRAECDGLAARLEIAQVELHRLRFTIVVLLSLALIAAMLYGCWLMLPLWMSGEDPL